MRKFTRQVSAGNTPDADLLLAIAEMFRDVEAAADSGSTDAQSVKKAMKLEAGRGRKASNSASDTWPQRSFCIAVERRRREYGESKPKALEAVCNERYVAEATAKRWHEKHWKSAQSHLDRMAAIERWVDEQDSKTQAWIELLARSLGDAEGDPTK
ncbi:hypothetical protein [Salinisphaera orenii]|uniref:hypothetical protein n=1 Tax=Salinisphaera orenii TaxID=856731 RepID=UPI000F4C0C28|nr:hypothetical protein [Salinisphaera orenii]